MKPKASGKPERWHSCFACALKNTRGLEYTETPWCVMGDKINLLGLRFRQVNAIGVEGLRTIGSDCPYFDHHSE